MSRRLRPGMEVPYDMVTSSRFSQVVTLIRFHSGGFLPEKRDEYRKRGWWNNFGPGWVCKFPDGHIEVIARRFLAVNQYDERGSGPPDPNRNDWYLNRKEAAT